MREQHPSPLIGEFAPPPGYEWTATLGPDGVGLVMILNGETVTGAQYPVESWSDVTCFDLVDMLKILAGKLKTWHQLANSLRNLGIDVQLETQIGEIRDNRYERATRPNA